MSKSGGKDDGDQRAERLKAALRANLRRRKEQQRARNDAHRQKEGARQAPVSREG